jgi:2-phospho-L-lactate/phosphoenolpyruvate guanylyltransferase
MMRWTVVMPMKSLPQAKTRLLDATDNADAHAELVRAMRADTIAAAEAARTVARVLIVVDRAGTESALTLVQRTVGLNPALDEAARHARERWPGDGTVAMVGDLPALTAADLDAVLVEAQRHERSFVADAAGTGTTLLAATPGVPLRPRFGPGSAARHAMLATLLAAAPGLRHDVDTLDDLRAAARVGVGTHTSAVLAALRSRSA